MTDTGELTRLLRNKKVRNVVVLAILLAILAFLIKIDLSLPPPRESERVLVCRDCGYTGVFKFSKLSDVECPKCHKRDMALGMKCFKCQYEFPKESKAGLRVTRCPNCNSSEIHPIVLPLWKKRHEGNNVK